MFIVQFSQRSCFFFINKLKCQRCSTLAINLTRYWQGKNINNIGIASTIPTFYSEAILCDWGSRVTQRKRCVADQSQRETQTLKPSLIKLLLFYIFMHLFLSETQHVDAHLLLFEKWLLHLFLQATHKRQIRSCPRYNEMLETLEAFQDGLCVGSDSRQTASYFLTFFFFFKQYTPQIRH